MSSVSVTNNSALTTGFFNSRFPQHVIPTGPFSTATERAQSIASAISMAASSNISYVYVPKQYTNYNASLISSDLTTSGVYLMVEGRGNALSAEAYGVDKTNDASRATENTVALQALLHAAPLGSEVELPDGVVVCNSTVTQHKRLRVSGQGPDSMLRFVQTNGSDGLVIGDGTATLDGWYLGNMAFSSESGAGSPWRLNCAHRGLAQNIRVAAEHVYLGQCDYQPPRHLRHPQATVLRRVRRERADRHVCGQRLERQHLHRLQHGGHHLGRWCRLSAQFGRERDYWRRDRRQ
jgi:hypothetical protein